MQITILFSIIFQFCKGNLNRITVVTEVTGVKMRCCADYPCSVSICRINDFLHLLLGFRSIINSAKQMHMYVYIVHLISLSHIFKNLPKCIFIITHDISIYTAAVDLYCGTNKDVAYENTVAMHIKQLIIGIICWVKILRDLPM